MLIICVRVVYLFLFIEIFLGFLLSEERKPEKSLEKEKKEEKREEDISIEDEFVQKILEAAKLIGVSSKETKEEGEVIRAKALEIVKEIRAPRAAKTIEELFAIELDKTIEKIDKTIDKSEKIFVTTTKQMIVRVRESLQKLSRTLVRAVVARARISYVGRYIEEAYRDLMQLEFPKIEKEASREIISPLVPLYKEIRRSLEELRVSLEELKKLYGQLIESLTSVFEATAPRAEERAIAIVEDLKAQLKEKTARISELEKELEVRDKRISELEKELAQLREKIAVGIPSESEIAERIRELKENYEKQLKEKENLIRELQEQLNESRSEIERLKAKIEELLHANKSLEDEVKRLREE